MSKKHVALVIAGAVVAAGAVYLCFRSRPKKQILKPATSTASVPFQESVEELKVKADTGDTSAMYKLARLLLKADDISNVKQDVPLALELLRKAAENGGVEAMMCDYFETLLHHHHKFFLL
jgi:TPR repeat protein